MQMSGGLRQRVILVQFNLVHFIDNEEKLQDKITQLEAQLEAKEAELKFVLSPIKSSDEKDIMRTISEKYAPDFEIAEVSVLRS